MGTAEEQGDTTIGDVVRQGYGSGDMGQENMGM